MGSVAALIAILLAATFGILVLIFVLVPLLKGLVWLIGHVLSFIGGEIGDVFRIIGAVITSVVFMPLVIGNIVIGRWSASAHFGRAIQSEFVTVGKCLYRIVIGHPARLLCLTSLTEGLEKRLPEAMAAAPGADKPGKRTGQFPGYTIVGSLQGGGSGGKLYVAEPDELKRAGFERQGIFNVEQVVIKVFSLGDGSKLPQIVRESRALEASKRLGLILDHEMSEDRFYYVMRYVPGEPLSLVTQRLHGQAGPAGLEKAQLRTALDYAADLLRTLHTYHNGGLWHKDVKPDNIIVDGHRAHLVDFGLLTPLRSALTLTTHGTEYFRDPELVRLALKGVKVSEVDGARFDIYGVGAVLFSVIENSFPAHGGMSRITRKCPEALRWIIRRAMTDYDKRYPSAMAMLADVEAVRLAPDPFAVTPADLPSMKGEPVAVPEPVQVDEPVAVGGFSEASSRAAEAVAAAAPAARAARPRIRMANWWTGAYTVHPGGQPIRAEARRNPAPKRPSTFGHPLGLSAKEQVERARQRAAAARARAQARVAGRRAAPSRKERYDNGVNAGVAAALFGFLIVCVGVAGLILGVHWIRTSPIRDPAAIARVDTGEAVVSLPAFTVLQAEPVALVRPRSPVGALIVMYRPTAFPPEMETCIERQLARLASRGYDIVGVGTELTQEEQDHVAQLWKAVGQAQQLSESARQSIRAWLTSDEQEHHFDGVIWIDKDEKDGSPRSWIVNAGTIEASEFERLASEFASTG
jgi:serine/threonine protein kinase